MNSLTQEILGLGLKGNKLGAPRYYELSEGQKDALGYTIGVGALLTAEEYEKRNRAKNLREAEERRKLDEEVRKQREALKNDTSFRPIKAEPVPTAKPVEKTPANPQPGPRPPRVNPNDVHPQTPYEDQNPDR